MLISQTLRPGDIVRFSTPYYALAPIAGLQMQEGAVTVDDLVLMRCNRAEWETVERGYVFKDWHSQYYHANPVFLYRSLTAPFAVDAIEPAFDDLAREAARLVSALRLYKTGRLLEPVYTIRFLVAESSFYRKVGPYRTEYLAMPIDDLTWLLESSELEDVGLLYSNLKTIEQMEGTEALRAVIDQFNLSHTPAITNFFSVHVLLTSMVMLFDGMPRQMNLKSALYDRVLAILHWWIGEGLDPDFDQFYQQRIHTLRNAVHHHTLRQHSVDLAEVKFRLQLPLMIGIRLLMRLHRTETAEGVAQLKKIEGWQDLGPKDVLNGCLDRFAAGDPAPLRTVMAA